MKILIFGGTTEGNIMAAELSAMGADVTLSVATDYGAESAENAGITSEGPGSVEIVSGLKDEAEMRKLMRGRRLCIDATHPFATEATANIWKAADEEGVPRLRVLRKKTELPGVRLQEEEQPSSYEPLMVDSAEEAAQILADLCSHKIMDPEARILLTTGAKDLLLYAERLGPERLYPRVLPLTQSLEACERAGIPAKNIIAAQGPFSRQFNEGLLINYGIDVMITKESGASGGYEEKIEACRNCGVKAVVIRRPKERGLSVEEALDKCRRLMAEG